ncbi:translation initiation factor IF-3 [Variovorax arabinosiphilus]|uniref:translation initiation factor IF-3 n=1 Tax=Variovorax arabinosiphilus TaxID=3053498 RepID=UPI002577F200|nr:MULTISPECIES: translation initiation factor IF-3 [unclassified Variovorax]MDM0120086.1 translation initiation factor IF-3 [Variovorax sp. J2L1-78]MDM0128001.1 translation initiation factor IF-3 [Variovorax sp. J2L1-63]MDM0231701.1 translation initiation factor IF-3 [Variovorax sp. J2R1-6]
MLTIATAFRDRRHREERQHRLNREIMAPEVRLVGPENEPLGVMSISEALRLAGEADVDLVEVVAAANPPVCRLIEYGKFKYHEQKKAAEAKSKQKVIEVKEIKFRPGTDDGDYNIKMRNIKRFLEEGDKCKITLRFRGREITHQELGLALLNRIRDELADLITVEQFPKLEGRQMIMMIAPGRKKAGAAAKPAGDAAAAPATASA